MAIDFSARQFIVCMLQLELSRDSEVPSSLLDLVADFIGVPPDNVVETRACEIANQTGKWPPYAYCRDWILDNWHDVTLGKMTVHAFVDALEKGAENHATVEPATKELSRRIKTLNDRCSALELKMLEREQEAIELLGLLVTAQRKQQGIPEPSPCS